MYPGATPSPLPVQPEELEFFAEEELITIVPNCSVPGKYVDGLLGRYGPFEPSRPLVVPVWLALLLHKRNRARILLPDWLTTARLEEAIEAERSSADSFSAQPYYYMELACLLLEHAREAFGGADDAFTVRDRLAQLANVRRHKMEQGLRQISATATVRVNGLGAYEVNIIRANLTGALNAFQRLEAVEASVSAAPEVGAAAAASASAFS